MPLRAAAPATTPPLATPAEDAPASLGRSRWSYGLASILLLAPCCWQEHVQAGDLSSHIYNAWLAQLIESGHGQGLVIVRQWTNVVFDVVLAGLLQLLGAEAAQRISVALAVLIFVWGAFAFAGSAAGRRPWHILPSIAMLAYGWVYHMGFFNFYVSMGLCFWAMALLSKRSLPRVGAAVAILALAWLAHALPVVWTGCLLAYQLLAGWLSTKGRVAALAASLAAMGMLHAAIASRMWTLWAPFQVALVTGLDQVGVFDWKYRLVEVGLLLVWGLLALNAIRQGGGRRLAGGMPLQFAALTSAGVLILPTSVMLPAYNNALSLISERMSLGLAICLCAVLATARPRRFVLCLEVAVALVFFGFLYRDERALNAFEDRLEQVVAPLPPNQRVVSAIFDPNTRVNAAIHLIDRVCVGHCFSIANYEPFTAQFRIRAERGNPYVSSVYAKSWLRSRTFVVRESDLPLYLVDLDANGRMAVKGLKAGVTNSATEWNILRDPLPPN